MAFTRPPRDVALVARDLAAPAGDGREHFDIKELQRRAFERGRQVEREAARQPLARICSGLEKLVAETEARTAADRTRVEEFAVSLAMAVAERLTHALVDAHAHDVNAMVHDLLASTGVDEGSEIRLIMNPEDRGRLEEYGPGSPLEGVAIEVDPALPLGDMALRGRHHETWSRMTERLEQARERLTEEARRG
ncbi:MAG: hypothetical protein R3F20_07395 [Planctomycetota bacterium]